MKKHIISRKIYLLVIVILLSGCTISREFGPYDGRVLDLETSNPIEGALVFLSFYTNFQLSPGGPVAKLADAIEVVTDSNGEFRIPAHKIEAFRVLHGWEPECTVMIFKPGYGVFPDHKKVRPRFRPAYSIPSDQYIVVWLPKLKTEEERRKNCGYLGKYRHNIPIDKHREFLQMYNAERQRFGWEPVGSYTEFN